MRKLALALLVAAGAFAGGACTDYFQGSQLVFEFDKLPALHRIEPADAWSKDNPTGELCADDAYAADPAHRDAVDNLNVLYQQPYEYHAWATVNDAPVRLARFTVRECTVNTGDTTVKNAVTTVSYVRLPAAEFGYPQKPSAWYGIVNAVVNSVPSGGATISTPVALDGATEIFITREDSATVTEDSGPVGTLLMRGDLVRDNQVITAKLVKVSGAASGLVTAIPADRVSAW